MKIIRKDRNNNYSYGAMWEEQWNEIYNHSNFRDLNKIKEDLLVINKIIETNFKDLTNEEFFNLISNFYDIELESKEILSILSKINGIEYDKYQRLNSKMTFKYIESEGHGRTFDSWEEIKKIGWIVAVSKDLDIDEEEHYSKEKIKEMALNKQIVCMKEFSRSLIYEDEGKEFKQEQLEKIEMDKIDFKGYNWFYLWWNYQLNSKYDETTFNIESLKNSDNDINKKVLDTAISMARKRLDKKKVLTYCKRYLLFLNEKIKYLPNRIEEYYKKEENQGNKDIYLNLISEINENCKKLLLEYK